MKVRPADVYKEIRAIFPTTRLKGSTIPELQKWAHKAFCHATGISLSQRPAWLIGHEVNEPISYLYRTAMQKHNSPLHITDEDNKGLMVSDSLLEVCPEKVKMVVCGVVFYLLCIEEDGIGAHNLHIPGELLDVVVRRNKGLANELCEISGMAGLYYQTQSQGRQENTQSLENLHADELLEALGKRLKEADDLKKRNEDLQELVKVNREKFDKKVAEIKADYEQQLSVLEAQYNRKLQVEFDKTLNLHSEVEGMKREAQQFLKVNDRNIELERENEALKRQLQEAIPDMDAGEAVDIDMDARHCVALFLEFCATKKVLTQQEASVLLACLTDKSATSFNNYWSKNDGYMKKVRSWAKQLKESKMKQ